jgi:hypothetical protein
MVIVKKRQISPDYQLQSEIEEVSPPSVVSEDGNYENPAVNVNDNKDDHDPP